MWTKADDRALLREGACGVRRCPIAWSVDVGGGDPEGDVGSEPKEQDEPVDGDQGRDPGGEWSRSTLRTGSPMLGVL
ncbi:hypothetical protein NDU88_001085 [Pleurodeles waltl]|uniref:Uncharacterized protein n=1 Tax=Pleurodeles waltl TaxID=8319 RepID=A0AAV7U9E6_PLEWA|nr:hypothetical protein NDU88_001085 [Pleurodeles waltl]